jgi:hypothetical protein
MNPPSQTDLVLLSNACRLLAVVTLLFATMGIAVLAALIFTECGEAVRESEARRRHRPTSPRRPPMLHINEVNT